jgi:hypothetical protein
MLISINLSKLNRLVKKLGLRLLIRYDPKHNTPTVLRLVTLSRYLDDTEYEAAVRKDADRRATV